MLAIILLCTVGVLILSIYAEAEQLPSE